MISTRPPDPNQKAHAEDVAWLVRTRHLAQQKPDLPRKTPATGFPPQEAAPLVLVWEGQSSVHLARRQEPGGVSAPASPLLFHGCNKSQ